MRQKKLEPLREQDINEIKNETKRKLNMLDDEINNFLEKLNVSLTTLDVYFVKNHTILKKNKN